MSTNDIVCQDQTKSPHNPQLVFAVCFFFLYVLLLFCQTNKLADTQKRSLAEFQQHKKLSPTRDEVILHTRKGKFSRPLHVTIF